MMSEYKKFISKFFDIIGKNINYSCTDINDCDSIAMKNIFLYSWNPLYGDYTFEEKQKYGKYMEEGYFYSITCLKQYNIDLFKKYKYNGRYVTIIEHLDKKIQDLNNFVSETSDKNHLLDYQHHINRLKKTKQILIN